MTKSRRKRSSILVRIIPEEELGPNFYSNLKHGLINQFEHEAKILLHMMNSLHNILAEKSQSLNEPLDYEGLLHVQIDRHTLIEGMTLVDEYIGQILHHYQIRKMNLSIPEVRNYTKVDEGIKECLNGISLPGKIDRLKSRISHYRALRNQYAHYKYGIFSFSANHESFESFLSTLDGIELQESQHCYIDGKAGVFLPYSISSGKYIGAFFSESKKFIEALLDFLFPTKKQNGC